MSKFQLIANDSENSNFDEILKSHYTKYFSDNNSNIDSVSNNNNSNNSVPNNNISGNNTSWLQVIRHIDIHSNSITYIPPIMGIYIHIYIYIYICIYVPI